MNLLDWILIIGFAVIVLCAVWKGFLHAAVELLGYLLALPAAIFSANACADWAYETIVHERAVQMVGDKLSAAASPAAFADTLKEILDGLPVAIDGILQSFHIDINQILRQIASASSTDIAEKFVNEAIRPVATILCTVVLFLVFFVVLMILVKIIAFLVGRFPLPSSIKKVNHLLGGVLGAVRALLLIFIASAVLQISADAGGKYMQNGFAGAVTDSVIVQAVNKYNPVMDTLIKD